MALQSVCAESKEERALPLLSKNTRAQHAHSDRRPQRGRQSFPRKAQTGI